MVMLLTSYWLENVDYHKLLFNFVNCITETCNFIIRYLEDTMEHLLLFVLTYMGFCFIMYIVIFKRRSRFYESRIIQARRILFVTAHPDDECMFFGPTVLHFTQRCECTVYLVCLSSGKNYGMNIIRKRELFAACAQLGIPESNVLVHNHTLLPDRLGEKWPPEIIGPLVLHYVSSLDIDTIVTFDKHGVSGHTNHSSIYYALSNLVVEKKLPTNCSIYVLDSVNVLRKYCLIVDLPISYLLSRVRIVIKSRADNLKLYHAMRLHESQFVWFRRVYLRCSRYAVLNTLQKMDLSDIELDLAVDD